MGVRKYASEGDFLADVEKDFRKCVGKDIQSNLKKSYRRDARIFACYEINVKGDDGRKHSGIQINFGVRNIEPILETWINKLYTSRNEIYIDVRAALVFISSRGGKKVEPKMFSKKYLIGAVREMGVDMGDIKKKLKQVGEELSTWVTGSIRNLEMD